MDPRPAFRRDLAGLLLVMILLKGWFVAALSDVFFYGEELEKGAAAKAMLDGLGVLHHQLAYHYYEGGGFVISHLKALMFLFVGENVLSHKLLAMLTCGAVLAAGWRLCAHHFGRRAGILFGLLFLFGPGSMQKLSLLSLGIHLEAMAFGLFILDEGLRIFAGEEGADRPGRLFRLGLVSGFGIYFSYQLLPLVGWVGLVLLVSRTRVVLSRPGAVGILGLMVGLMPLLMMIKLVGTAVFDVHGSRLVSSDGVLQKLGTFFSSVYLQRSPGEMIPYLLYPTLALALCVVAVRGGVPMGRAKSRILVGYCLVWIASWIVSGFVSTHSEHYFTWMRFAPLWLVLTVLAARALDCGAAMGRGRRRVALALLAVWLVAGSTASIRILSAGRPLQVVSNVRFISQLKGYHYLGYFPMLVGHLSAEGSAKLEPLLRYDEPCRELLLTDIANAAFRDQPPNMIADLSTLHALDQNGYLELVRGMGLRLSRSTRGDLRAALMSAQAMGPELGPALGEALGRSGRSWHVTPTLLKNEVTELLDAPLAEAYQRGAGARVLRSFMVRAAGGPEFLLDPEACREYLRTFPREASSHLLRGFEQELERWLLRSHGTAGGSAPP